MPDTIADQIRAFIVENFLFGDEDHALGDELSLVENDIVDSTGILEMVSFLEERFGITVADADIVPANLDSVARLVAFVARKQAGERAAG